MTAPTIHDISAHDVPKAYRSLARQAIEAGWRIQRTRRHLKWMPPSKQGVVITANTPSDVRSMLNARAQLRRLGLHI